MRDYIAMTACVLEVIPGDQDARGWQKYKCAKCGRLTGYTPHGPDRIIINCRLTAAVPGEQPGTELKSLISTLGASPTKSCGCAMMIRLMNSWGCEGCEKHLPEIVAHLRKAYGEQPLLDKLRAQAAAVTSGLAFQLDWTDPIPSLVRLAIARARKP